MTELGSTKRIKHLLSDLLAKRGTLITTFCIWIGVSRVHIPNTRRKNNKIIGIIIKSQSGRICCYFFFCWKIMLYLSFTNSAFLIYYKKYYYRCNYLCINITFLPLKKYSVVLSWALFSILRNLFTDSWRKFLKELLV